MDFPKLYNHRCVIGGGCDSSEEGLKVNNNPSQNLVNRLVGREMWGGFNAQRSETDKYLQRAMYQSIVPNFTITRVVKPPCFLGKFTPDGDLFVAFSSDRAYVELYYFQGPHAANHLFIPLVDTWMSSRNNDSKMSSTPDPSKRQEDPYSNGFPDLIGPDEKDTLSQGIRMSLFDAFFKLKFRIRAAPQGEQLNTRCFLFTEDGRYLIVGSATNVQDDLASLGLNRDPFRTNESVEPNLRFPLEDYSIHIVDLKMGVLSDSHCFNSDRINLWHNQGLYLYQKTLAVLSVQHQTVHIFQIDNGQFWPIRTVGRFCYEDDEMFYYSSLPSFEHIHAKDEAFHGSLKQKLLSFVYKRAHERAYKSNPPEYAELSRFHHCYNQLAALKIWKMQLLDQDNLLLKYSTSDVVTQRSLEPNSQICIFVVYNLSLNEVKEVFDNTTEDFVDLYEKYADSFRNTHLTMGGRFVSSPSNNLYSRQSYQTFCQAVTIEEATKRVQSSLPMNPQSFHASPYLDMSLFSYDDRRVSSIEWPKACGEIPIRFYGRDTGIYKFQLHAGILSPGGVPPSAMGRHLATFIFHPSAPFAISLQRANTEYLVHFHIRMDPQSNLP